MAGRRPMRLPPCKPDKRAERNPPTARPQVPGVEDLATTIVLLLWLFAVNLVSSKQRWCIGEDGPEAAGFHSSRGCESCGSQPCVRCVAGSS